MRTSQAPGDQQSAALVKAFAALRGCSLRTAQRHRAQGSEEWLAFVATGSAVPAAPVALADPAPSPAEEGPSIYDVERPDTGDPYEDEVIWAQRVKSRAIELGREDQIATATERLNKALELRRRARTTEARAGRDLGELVPWAVVLPALERMCMTMAEGLRGSILATLERVLPDSTQAERRLLATEIVDNCFRLWTPEALQEAAAAA